MAEEVWITVIATRFDSPFARRHHRDSQSGPSEPRRAGEDRRDRDSDRDRDRERDRSPRRDFGYGDPVGDWRSDGDRVSRGTRHAKADELYGGDLRGRGQDRRPTHPADTRGGLVLDVPEFIPGH
jgi:hypothetical protein